MISPQKKKPSGFDEPRVGGVRGHPTQPVSSFIPIHFNYAVIPALFPVSWLAQPGNLQLIWPHLRFSRGGGRESSRNGMKCHSVVAFVTKMLGGDAEWLGRSLKTCAAGCSVVLLQKWTAIWAPALLCAFCPPFKLQASLSWTQKKKKSRSPLSSAMYQLVLRSSSRLLHLFHWGWAGCRLSPLALQCDAHNSHLRIRQVFLSCPRH